MRFQLLGSFALALCITACSLLPTLAQQQPTFEEILEALPPPSIEVHKDLTQLLESKGEADWEDTLLFWAFAGLLGEGRKPCVGYLDLDTVVLNPITLEKKGTIRSIVTAAAQAAKLDCEPHGSLILIGSGEQIKSYKAIRERNTKLCQRLARDPANRPVLQALAKEIHCEFAVRELKEVFDFIEKKSQIEIRGEPRRSKIAPTLNNRAPLQEVLTVLAIQEKFDWTTDGHVVFIGTPDAVAQFDRDAAKRAPRN